MQRKTHLSQTFMCPVSLLDYSLILNFGGSDHILFPLNTQGVLIRFIRKFQQILWWTKRGLSFYYSCWKDIQLLHYINKFLCSLFFLLWLFLLKHSNQCKLLNWKQKTPSIDVSSWRELDLYIFKFSSAVWQDPSLSNEIKLY